MKSIVYVRIKQNLLSIKNVSQGLLFEDIPRIAINHAAKKAAKKIEAVGKNTDLLPSKTEIQIMNGFDHPRTIISNFEVAEWTLAYFLRHVHTGWARRFRTQKMILHPLEKLEGGLTQVEVRALV